MSIPENTEEGPMQVLPGTFTVGVTGAGVLGIRPETSWQIIHLPYVCREEQLCIYVNFNYTACQKLNLTKTHPCTLSYLDIEFQVAVPGVSPQKRGGGHN